MEFRYQAIDAKGQTQVDTISAGSPAEAGELLRGRGLFVTRIDLADSGQEVVTPVPHRKKKFKGKLRDVLLFTQQMSMLTRSGARVMQGLEAIEEQCSRSAWRNVVRSVRADVEEGRPLSAALGRFPKMFPPVYTSMVSAGEASGELGLSFDRLAKLMKQLQEIRARIIGALTYPALLLVLCSGVLIVMFTFVLPRFSEMFETLDMKLPMMTSILIACSRACREYWYLVVTLVLGIVGGGVTFFHSAAGRQFASWLVVRLPVFGRVFRSVIVARICRVWGELLESKVDMLESIQLTQASTPNNDFRKLLNDLEQAITDGNSIGPVLRESWLIPNTFSAAIVTGEESGKLAISLLFVAESLEDTNAQVLNSLSRLVEPIMLVVMGVIVGTVALSLFLPMFDAATVGGR